MIKKSKYDILEKEFKNNSVLALNLVLRLLNIKDKMKTNSLKMSQEQIDNILDEVLPVMITFASIGYENVKDLENVVAKEELIKYLKQEKIDPVEFSSNYLKNINTYIKLLLIVAILKKEKAMFPNLKDPQTALNLLGGHGINNDTFNDLFTNLSVESRNLIKEILNNNFNINEITNHQKELLEEYHYKYMSKNIYDKVKDEREKPQMIMKLAKSYAVKVND